MYFALQAFLHCAFVSFSPSLYFGMQNWSVQFFFMNQAVYHAWDLLFLFFHLSGSKLYSWVLPWNWEFGCSCFFFVSGTDFKGILYLLLSVFMIEKMPVPAFLAVCGMTVGEIVSFFFTLIFYFLHKKSADSLSKSTLSASKLSVFHELLSLGIPLTLNSFSVTLLQSVQSILIPMMLYRFYGNRYPRRRDLWHLKRHGTAFYHVSFYDHQCIIFDASA